MVMRLCIHSNFIDTVFAIQISMQSITIIQYPLYDTAMILCEGVQKRSGGPLYDTAVIICKGV